MKLVLGLSYNKIYSDSVKFFYKGGSMIMKGAGVNKMVYFSLLVVVFIFMNGFTNANAESSVTPIKFEKANVSVLQKNTVSKSEADRVNAALGVIVTFLLDDSMEENAAPIEIIDINISTTAGSNLEADVENGILGHYSELERERLVITAIRAGRKDENGNSGVVGSGLVSVYGTLTLQADGSYVYILDQEVPEDLETDEPVDYYTYTVSDGEREISAEIMISTISVNEAPVAVNDKLIVVQDSNGTIVVSLNDNDSDGGLDLSTVEVVRNPLSGRTIVDNVTGKILYIPNNGYEGEDQFSYIIKDNKGKSSNEAIVEVKVLRMGLNKVTESESRPENWYLRIVAEDITRGMQTGDTQLGQLNEDTDVALKHSLKALQPFSTGYIDVVFRDPPDIDSGDYKSSFHLYREDADEWEFIVKADEANADIILSWRGLYILTPYVDEQSRLRYREYRSLGNPLIKYMKLLDVSTGTEVPAVQNGEAQTYTFNMGGALEKVFRWVIQNSEVSILSTKSLKSQPQQEKVLKEGIKINNTTIEESSKSFKWGTPPKFEIAR